MARNKQQEQSDAILEGLRAFGLRYPGAHIKSPWPGHMDLAVNDKTFAYMSVAGEPLKVSCKLPRSSDAALSLPFTAPTEYGLGKSGWVTAWFEPGQDVPVSMLEAWIDESYRAQAPKRLSRGLPPIGGDPGVNDRAAGLGVITVAAAGAKRRVSKTAKPTKAKAAPAPKRAAKAKAARASKGATKAKAARPRRAELTAEAKPASKATKRRAAARSSVQRSTSRARSPRRS